MAKALVLSDEILDAPVPPPRAAQASLAPLPAAKVTKAPVQQVPLQIRIPAQDAKAIRRAALEADQTISDFMLACFHAHMKA